MMNSGTPFYRRASFIALRRQWYARLRAKGFTDLELGQDGREKKLLPGLPRPRGADQVYYDDCRVFLASHRFRAALERRVYRLHCDGAPQRAIARKVGRSLGWVNKVLQRLERERLGSGRSHDPRRKGTARVLDSSRD